jgi:hypothetical protein
MRKSSPQNLLRALLWWDSSRAEQRGKYIYPAPGWFARKENRDAAELQRNHYAPLRAWLDEHVAAWPDLVVIDSIIDQIPPPLADGHTRIQLANVVQHSLKNAGCTPLGQFKEIAGRHYTGARLWAIRDGVKFSAFDRDRLLQWYLLQDPVTVERYRMKHHAAADAAVQWLRDHPPTLPTLAYAPDIAAALPPDMPITDGQRTHAAEQYLRELGAAQLGEHQTEQGRRKLWATRDIERLAAMKPRERVQEIFGRVPYERERAAP